MNDEKDSESKSDPSEKEGSVPLSERPRITMEFIGEPLELPTPSAGNIDLSVPNTLLDLGDPKPEESAVELVERSRSSEVEIDFEKEMQECFVLDDFTGALRMAELILGRDPCDSRALEVAEESKKRLEQLYTSRLGHLGSVPIVLVSEAELRWLGLDARAAFLLSRIDGKHNVEEILDMSGMPRIEALKTLVELKNLKAIRFVSR